MEERVLGVWTHEEFKDTLIFAAVAAIITFLLTLFYRWVSKYLELT